MSQEFLLHLEIDAQGRVQSPPIVILLDEVIDGIRTPDPLGAARKAGKLELKINRGLDTVRAQRFGPLGENWPPA